MAEVAIQERKMEIHRIETLRRDGTQENIDGPKVKIFKAYVWKFRRQQMRVRDKLIGIVYWSSKFKLNRHCYPV
ncbi:hypothetical protein ElyMa_006152700 [Elysia marginata]|uniref:Uncharacterized protein n=1 Tax=Elysia marginata TaxID=1093978 RepID=A0AAV4GZ65_9GAST|nr:hypothetical protein ElyMa_006152700 [Elysia marginata]